eukprot:768411-Hanusia_phi.AAC.10
MLRCLIADLRGGGLCPRCLQPLGDVNLFVLIEPLRHLERVRGILTRFQPVVHVVDRLLLQPPAHIQRRLLVQVATHVERARPVALLLRNPLLHIEERVVIEPATDVEAAARGGVCQPRVQVLGIRVV